MKKIKKAYLYILTILFGFIFGHLLTYNKFCGKNADYNYMSRASLPYNNSPGCYDSNFLYWLYAVVLSPLFAIIIFLLSLIIGSAMFIKHRKKRAKKNT